MDPEDGMSLNGLKSHTDLVGGVRSSIPKFSDKVVNIPSWREAFTTFPKPMGIHPALILVSDIEVKRLGSGVDDKLNGRFSKEQNRIELGHAITHQQTKRKLTKAGSPSKA